MIGKLHAKLERIEQNNSLLDIFTDREAKQNQPNPRPSSQLESKACMCSKKPSAKIVIRQAFEMQGKEQYQKETAVPARPTSCQGVPKWKRRREQHLLKNLRRNHEIVEASLIEQEIKHSGDLVQSATAGKSQGFQGRQLNLPMKEIKKRESLTQLELVKSIQDQQRAISNSCLDCNSHVQQKRQSLIQNYRTSLQEQDDSRVAMHEMRVSRRVRFLMEVKKKYLLEPLSAVIIAGGDEWPQAKQPAAAGQVKAQPPQWFTEQKVRPSTTLEEPATKSAKKSQQDLKLDARQVSFGNIPLIDNQKPILAPSQQAQVTAPTIPEPEKPKVPEMRRKLTRFKTKPDIQSHNEPVSFLQVVNQDSEEFNMNNMQSPKGDDVSPSNLTLQGQSSFTHSFDLRPRIDQITPTGLATPKQHNTKQRRNRVTQMISSIANMSNLSPNSPESQVNTSTQSFSQIKPLLSQMAQTLFDPSSVSPAPVPPPTAHQPGQLVKKTRRNTVIGINSNKLNLLNSPLADTGPPVNSNSNNPPKPRKSKIKPSLPWPPVEIKPGPIIPPKFSFEDQQRQLRQLAQTDLSNEDSSVQPVLTQTTSSSSSDDENLCEIQEVASYLEESEGCNVNNRRRKNPFESSPDPGFPKMETSKKKGKGPIEYNISSVRRLSKMGTSEDIGDRPLSKVNVQQFHKTDTMANAEQDAKDSFENSPDNRKDGFSTQNLVYNRHSGQQMSDELPENIQVDKKPTATFDNISNTEEIPPPEDYINVKKHHEKQHVEKNAIEAGSLQVPAGSGYRRMNTSFEKRRPSGKDSASSANGASKKAKKLLIKKAAEVAEKKGDRGIKKMRIFPAREDSNQESNHQKVSSKNLSLPSKKESMDNTNDKITLKKEPTKKVSQFKLKDENNESDSESQNSNAEINEIKQANKITQMLKNLKHNYRGADFESDDLEDEEAEEEAEEEGEEESHEHQEDGEEDEGDGSEFLMHQNQVNPTADPKPQSHSLFLGDQDEFKRQNTHGIDVGGDDNLDIHNLVDKVEDDEASGFHDLQQQVDCNRSVFTTQKTMKNPRGGAFLNKGPSNQLLTKKTNVGAKQRRRGGMIFDEGINLDVQSMFIKKQKPKIKKLIKDDDSIFGNNQQPLRKMPTRRESSVMTARKVRKFKNKQDGQTMINQYVVEKTLGKGSFATVKLCHDKESKMQYAIKIMNKKELKKKSTGNGKNAYDCVLEELQVLQKLEHPNIIFLHEIIDDEKKDDIYLVTEYHSKGSLGDQVLEKNKALKEHNDLCKKEKRFNDMRTMGLNEEFVRVCFGDMLKALYYCHKVVKVIHRDIKPDNIMINHNNVAVLIDFGVSALVEGQEDDELDNNMGSYMFFAPEMFERKTKGIKVRGERTDIWALGITLYYLLCGRYPFEEAISPLQLKELIVEKPIDFRPIKKNPARELLARMLEKDPETRATIDEIRESEWLLGKEKRTIEVDKIDENKGTNHFGIARLLAQKGRSSDWNLLSQKTKKENQKMLLGDNKDAMEQVNDDSAESLSSESSKTSSLKTDSNMSNLE